MNRNTELHFKNTPSIDLKRSKFEESHSHKTSFNVGDIVPVFVDPDILPGDTVQMDMAELIRMATPIYPIMDNLYADIYWFFVPHRLVWEHWAEFWGENDDPWTQEQEYEIPQIEAPTGGWTEGTIADYMGIPTKVGNISVNAMPFRAYAKTYNDWFRDENLKKNCHIYKDETTRTGQNGTETGYSYVTGVELGGLPAKAAKMHDYFTSALPEPQKGQAVTIPLGQLAPLSAGTNAYIQGDLNAKFPVETQNENVTFKQGTPEYGIRYNFNKDGWGSSAQIPTISSGTYKQMVLLKGPGGTGSNEYIKQGLLTNSSTLSTAYGIYPTNLIANANEITGKLNVDNINNIYTDLSSATAATINSLRTAFAIQKYFENAGLHGTRYIEYIRSVFGVTSSDARLQRAEYLGGERLPINIDQIIQTSSTDATSPQGNTAGLSCTINRQNVFTKSFEEHGTLLCLMTIRTEHTYQQGLHKKWTRKKWTDFYNPFFANLGEMPILNENIYAQGNTVVDTDGNIIDKQAFGYQEAWAEYRYKENYVTGYMRSNATGSLDVWHFADDYNSLPYLSGEWIDEPYENVDRTIAVTSALTHQFIADLYFKCYYTRPMPVYSIPGLIDHV